MAGDAGALFWLLASNSYPDHDGYSVYTSRVAASQPQPHWPALTQDMIDEVKSPCSIVRTSAQRLHGVVSIECG